VKEEENRKTKGVKRERNRMAEEIRLKERVKEGAGEI